MIGKKIQKNEKDADKLKWQQRRDANNFISRMDHVRSIRNQMPQSSIKSIDAVPKLDISICIYTDQPSVLRINEHKLKRVGLHKITDNEMFKYIENKTGITVTPDSDYYKCWMMQEPEVMISCAPSCFSRHIYHVGEKLVMYSSYSEDQHPDDSIDEFYTFLLY